MERGWNARQSFVSHEFLLALGANRLRNTITGWQAMHLALRDEQGAHCACDAVSQNASWGEFVFDFGWANAYAQLGLNIFQISLRRAVTPGLAAIAYFPHAKCNRVRKALLDAMIELQLARSSSITYISHCAIKPRRKRGFLSAKTGNSTAQSRLSKLR